MVKPSYQFLIVSGVSRPQRFSNKGIDTKMVGIEFSNLYQIKNLTKDNGIIGWSWDVAGVNKHCFEECPHEYDNASSKQKHCKEIFQYQDW